LRDPNTKAMRRDFPPGGSIGTTSHVMYILEPRAIGTVPPLAHPFVTGIVIRLTDHTSPI
jgi:hypothetical protein